jgi:hypothetical protein
MTEITWTRDRLGTADLVVDAVYEGGRAGNAGDDPLGPLLGVSNQGGFRHLGQKDRPNLLAITSSMNEPDWPDHLDLETGLFTYYGDNRHPGRDLHETPRWGNLMLRDLFERVHAFPSKRQEIAPVFVFRTAGTYRDVRFLGLAVPGAAGIPPTDDLVAIWRHVRGQRFQNYRAVFSILDISRISRAWIDDVKRGNFLTSNAPEPWRAWSMGGQPARLRSTSSRQYRSREDQLPSTDTDRKIIKAIHDHFAEDPYEFEECAAQIAEMLLPSVVDRDLTRRSRDGGRDAVGKYRIGSEITGIKVDFALEAKCYAPDCSVGVKDASRLISRLRHRQFGILVTTSYVHSQAYQEIVDDGHPILIICGRDIASILRTSGIRDERATRDWLAKTFQVLAKRSADVVTA